MGKVSIWVDWRVPSGQAGGGWHFESDEIRRAARYAVKQAHAGCSVEVLVYVYPDDEDVTDPIDPVASFGVGAWDDPSDVARRIREVLPAHGFGQAEEEG